jgi:hypothetical protein
MIPECKIERAASLGVLLQQHGLLRYLYGIPLDAIVFLSKGIMFY